MTHRHRRLLTLTALLLVLLLLVLGGASSYMLSFSLSPDPGRHNTDSAYQQLYARFPDMQPWTDSLRQAGKLRDTTITLDDGRRAHAIYVRADSAHGRTALLVHGYKDAAVKFLYLGRMYHRDLGLNILLPDLSAHGQSDGTAIQMGWLDRHDVRRWTEVARDLFRTPTDTVSILVHGVSMGAATTMCLSGDSLPAYVRCFVEDCGYTSVWDEFEGQLREQFSLPAFPLMWTTSALCRVKYGWSFGEASALRQVARCHRPMLFIHGTDDTFVPTSMVRPLYDAKPQPKELWLAPGSAHARSYTDHPQEYTRRVARFVHHWLP